VLYNSAEITTAWLHVRGQTDRHVLVFCVVELCPPGQPASVALSSGQHPLVRASIDDTATLYVRREFVAPQEGIAFYRGTGGTAFPSSQAPPIAVQAPLSPFPPDGDILLIPPNSSDDSSPGAVLPRRHTSLRILSRYDKGRAIHAFLGEKRMKRIGEGLRDILGVDLGRFPENLGAIHCCFANPVVGRMETRRSSDGCNLLVSLLERPGRSVIGGQIEISSEWPSFGLGFCIRRQLESRFLVVPLPAAVESVRVRIFDQTGLCIEDHPATGRHYGGMTIAQSVGSSIRIEEELEDGTIAELNLETFASMNPSTAREREPSMHEYLKASRVDRELEDLRKSKVLVFFPGGADSRQDATRVLRELIGRARRKCTVVDPFFSRGDALQLMEFVRHSSCTVRFLSSQEQLSKRDRFDVTAEYRLATALAKLSPKLPYPVEARILEGKGMHDRWLQIDDAVYLIGSSINHFGGRATMLYQLQRPEELLGQIDRWWEESKPLSAEPNGRTFGLLAGRLREQWKGLRRTVGQMIELCWKQARSE
jgi:hypothetical protein